MYPCMSGHINSTCAYTGWNIHTRSYSWTHTYTMQQTQKWTLHPYAHSWHFNARVCIDTVTCVINLMATSSLPCCWNIHAINKRSIINKPQNGSNCSLQPNVSISIPRTFVEQPKLFLLSVSSMGKKRHWFAEYSQCSQDLGVGPV